MALVDGDGVELCGEELPGVSWATAKTAAKLISDNNNSIFFMDGSLPKVVVFVTLGIPRATANPADSLAFQNLYSRAGILFARNH